VLKNFTHFLGFILILSKFTAEGEQKYEVRLLQLQYTKQDVILRNGGESFNDHKDRKVRRLLTLTPRAANGEIRHHIVCELRK
jgi:hypothetical protein